MIFSTTVDAASTCLNIKIFRIYLIDSVPYIIRINKPDYVNLQTYTPDKRTG